MSEIPTIPNPNYIMPTSPAGGGEFGSQFDFPIPREISIATPVIEIPSIPQPPGIDLILGPLNSAMMRMQQIDLPDLDIPDIPQFELPQLDPFKPGMPNILLAALTAQLAGVQYILSFIPPDPKKLPKLLDLSFFQDIAMSNINLPIDIPQIPTIPQPNFPEIAIPLPEIPIPPIVMHTINMIQALIKVVFDVITFVIKQVMKLILAIPTLDEIIQMVTEALVNALPPPPPMPPIPGQDKAEQALAEVEAAIARIEAIKKQAGCIAGAFYDLLISFLPV